MNMEIVKYIYEKLCMVRFEGHNYVLVNLNKSLGEIHYRREYLNFCNVFKRLLSKYKTS